MKKKIKKSRKVTAKDLDEWSKRVSKDTILYGKSISIYKGEKLERLSPEEFEGAQE